MTAPKPSARCKRCGIRRDGAVHADYVEGHRIWVGDPPRPETGHAFVPPPSERAVTDPWKGQTLRSLWEECERRGAEIARLRAVVERLRDMPGPEADPDSHAEEEATETWWPFWAGFALSLRREARRALEREES